VNEFLEIGQSSAELGTERSTMSPFLTHHVVVPAILIMLTPLVVKISAMHLVFILFDTTLHVRQTKLCNISLHIIVIATKLHFMICL